MQNRATTLHRKASATAGLIGAAFSLSPVPLSDEIVLAALYAELARRIGKENGLGWLRVPWRPIGVTVAKGLFARGFVNIGLSFIPGVDTVVNAMTAAGLTEVLAAHMEESCADPAQARVLSWDDLVAGLRDQRVRAERRKRRMRFEVPGLVGRPSKAPCIEEKLRAIPDVIGAFANARSGRVLVTTRVPIAERIESIERALAELSDPSAPPPPSLKRLGRGAARRVRRWANAASAIWKRGGPREAPSLENGHVRPWHAMSIGEVLAELNVDATAGLATEDVKQRLRRHGANVLPGMRRRTGLDIVAGEVLTLPTAMLGGAIGLSILSGDWLEGAAIALVLGSNVVIGYFTESRAEELLLAWEQLRVERATVVRNGREVPVRTAELVPGDVLVLRPGDPIAADARVLQAEDLLLDESTLTGESEPVEKSDRPTSPEADLSDRSSIVHAGTVVASGRGKAIVCATGSATSLGALQRALSRAGDRAAPLEEQLAELGRTLAWISLGSSVVVTAFGLARRQPTRMLVRNGIALGIAAIPEGFPTVGTTALALASQRLRKKGIIIRRLAAAETLGAVSVICADKTGTLTENRMRIAEALLPSLERVEIVWTDGEMTMRTERGTPPDERAMHNLARIAALNADVEISGGRIAKGSGTERALVQFAIAAGYPVRERRRSAKRVGEKRRSPESPIMVTIHEHPELGRIELAKGAPEELVPRCDGLSSSELDAIMRSNEAMAGRGLRVLGFAWRRSTAGPLEFAGLVALRDPPRPHVREAIESVAAAHIEMLMLTGDQQRTALAIGEALGIAADKVYSRVTSEAKLDIVQQLQARGSIVAMTGDGVNDGPALKAADVGIAMGERGTDVARAVADVVLTHDDFPSLVEAVGEGRTLYDNVRRAIDYLVATNLSEVVLMVAGSVVGFAPLAPLHLLWINILTDVAPALALAVEPAERDVMKRPPRRPQTPLFGQSDAVRLGSRSAQMAAGAMASYAIGRARSHGAENGYAKTMAFTSLVTSQLLETANYRAETTAPGRPLRWVLGASFVAQATSLLSPAVRMVLGNARLAWFDLAMAVASGASAARWRGRAFGWLAPDQIVVERISRPSGARSTS